MTGKPAQSRPCSSSPSLTAVRKKAQPHQGLFAAVTNAHLPHLSTFIILTQSR